MTHFVAACRWPPSVIRSQRLGDLGLLLEPAQDEEW